MKQTKTSKRRPAGSTASSPDSSSPPDSIARNGGRGDVGERPGAIEKAAGESATDTLMKPTAALANEGWAIAAVVELTWVKRFAGDNTAAQERLLSELSRFKTRLRGPAPTPIEEVLVARVASCWIQANYADANEGAAEARTLAQAELDAKRQTLAHKRLLAALKTLAEVRRLLQPSLQVNIAEQQVNVAG